MSDQPKDRNGKLIMVGNILKSGNMRFKVIGVDPLQGSTAAQVECLDPVEPGFERRWISRYDLWQSYSVEAEDPAPGVGTTIDHHYQNKRTWWTIPETGYNQGLQIPTFALGEMIWWRADPRESCHVIGIALQAGWQDDEANEWHEPYWQFQVTGNHGWYADSDFIGRAEHGPYLKAWQARLEIASQADDFDPFLDLP